ncbi:DUF2511 domain-containing protein [Thermaerobacter composti]|uniref:DUF2511 domain-containing protein n=1 Tax=Thermaerobacter composti TaxID=554949 RepID=A0ABZ0QKE5_9FIRM|nr:DUF2511 domain-containing protein [Thermaerobacter composti]WPD17984.1 DUF2511 domain-containing protein [Thermaerobacter composti]
MGVIPLLAMKSRNVLAALGVLVLFLLAGCSGDPSTGNATQTTTPANQEPGQNETASSSHDEALGTRISAEDLGEEWPLTVDSGYLRCDQQAVIFHHDGVDYAVNGTAKSRGLPPIDPIWADGDIAGTKKDIGPLIQRGLTLCE